jgi:hypothetical protein
VETWGSDVVAAARRDLNLPFRTPWNASVYATNAGMVIQLGYGYFPSRGFYLANGVSLFGKGDGLPGQANTICTFWPTNWTIWPSGTFSSPNLAPGSNSVIAYITVTNAAIIGSNNIKDPVNTNTLGQDCDNCYFHDLTIYAPLQTQTYGFYQAPYLNAAMRFKSVNNSLCERVKLYSGGIGFEIVGSIVNTNAQLTLRNCFVICSPQFSALGTNDAWAALGRPGGMQPIAISQQASHFGILINIDGGTYMSLGGVTNRVAPFQGATTNLNACIYVPSNTVAPYRISLANMPRLVFGATNTGARALSIMDSNSPGNQILITGAYLCSTNPQCDPSLLTSNAVVFR